MAEDVDIIAKAIEEAEAKWRSAQIERLSWTDEELLANERERAKIEAFKIAVDMLRTRG